MAVDRRFQHHLIIRVAQAGPPQKMGFHGIDQGSHAVQKHLHVSGADAGGLLVFGPAAHRFVFDDQRYVRNQRDAAIQCGQEQGRRRTGRAAQRRNDHICIQYHTHTVLNHISGDVKTPPRRRP
jgi:hypothetical protein